MIGDVIIVDSENGRVQHFTGDGIFIQVIASRGSATGLYESVLCRPGTSLTASVLDALPNLHKEGIEQLGYPLCVALSCNDTVVMVTDAIHACVKLFTILNADFITCYGQGHLRYPCGLAVTSEGDIIVTDLALHSVLIFTQRGKLRHSFGNYGQSPEQMDQPCFVAVNEENQIIISDTGNTSVKIFSLNGQLLQCFTDQNFHINSDHCIILQGITVDDEGNTLIVANNSVYILAANGRFWDVLASSDGLHGPRAIAYHKDTLVITQYDLHTTKHQVSVFKYQKQHFRSLKTLASKPSTLNQKRCRVKRSRDQMTSSSDSQCSI